MPSCFYDTSTDEARAAFQGYRGFRAKRGFSIGVLRACTRIGPTAAQWKATETQRQPLAECPRARVVAAPLHQVIGRAPDVYAFHVGSVLAQGATRLRGGISQGSPYLA
jgi:hypothetical protein